MIYIAMDYDGLRQLIMDMLGNQRCRIDVESLQNGITSSTLRMMFLRCWFIWDIYLAYDNKNKKFSF